MKSTIKALIFTAAVALMLGGCASHTCKHKCETDRAVPGTDTVFVGVYVTKDGKVETTTEREILHPGQRAIFSSANEFELVFKDGKSPVGETTLKSSNGVLTVKIPKGIFEEEIFVKEFRKNNELVFNYDINVGDLTLDPPMIVRPR